MKTVYHSHDLNLPDWGPYTKKYFGISHIPDVSSGIRFDLAVFPGLDNYRSEVPDVHYYSGYHLWNAAADLSNYTVRHELQWKDKVYTDITYLQSDDHVRLIRSTSHNYTDEQLELCMHYAASSYYPTPSHSTIALSGVTMELPDEAVLLLAVDYQDLCFATPRIRDNLGWDGMRRGEEPAADSVAGYVVGQNFGAAGDKISYSFEIKRQMESPCICIRYRNLSAETITLRLSTGEFLRLPPTSCFAIAQTTLAKSVSEEHFDVTLTSCGGENLQLDCLILCEQSNTDNITIIPRNVNLRAKVYNSVTDSFAILHYPQENLWYGFVWFNSDMIIREYSTNNLDMCIRFLGRDPISLMPQSDGKGHIVHMLQRPIILDANQVKSVYSAVCWGKTQEDVEIRCRTILSEERSILQKWSKLDTVSDLPDILAEGKKYESSQKRMKALLCTNVVYPVYTRRQYIRHNTPGRIWDSLYTWDSGFAGMGLLQYSQQRAFECLDAYLTPPGDDEAAFIHHGSLVPTQFYLFGELLNRSSSDELIAYCYPRLVQYYEFMIGRSGSSTLASLESGLLRPWDYFYNSGGWDDYPPQKYIHENNMEQTVAPVVTTSHVIRCAKILAYLAKRMNRNVDANIFQADVTRLSDALKCHSWDEASGYYGYVLHDTCGSPVGILRYQENINFNMGLGGVSPLFADVCTDEQAKKLWQHLETEGELWSSCGLSTVDQRAPYYRDDGYWNGAVWMPYQWMYFKAALDAGKTDIAFRIAKTALDLWAKETDATYNCYEHFMIRSRRGSGWHQFGALSAPVTQWFSTYYIPGTVTTGFNCVVRNQKWENAGSVLKLELDFMRTGVASIILTFRPGPRTFICSEDMRIAEIRQRHPGVWELKLDVMTVDTVCLHTFDA